MIRLLVLFFYSMFAASTGTAQEIGEGKWVKATGLSCNATCGGLHPLSPGRNAAGKRYYVCAARIKGGGTGLRPGYSVRGTPNTCNVQDGNGYKKAKDFACYCVVTSASDQK